MSAHLDRFEVFPWNSNFETGIAIIDQQHRMLVELLNKLANLLIEADEASFNQVFDDLAAYARHHFDTEEAEWEPYFGHDPWFAAHQKSHGNFLPKLRRIQQEQADKPLGEAIRHTVGFLIRWLTHHIIDSDKRMAIVLREMDAGASLADAKTSADEQMSDSEQVLIDTVLLMYDQVSSRTLELMRERVERKKVELKLGQAMHEMEQLAITDQLTGLYNRRHFDNVFEQELRRAKRDRHALSFMMLDIDHFKRLNDRYGHLKGDAALQHVAHKLMALCRRPGDFVFRLGGEEFAILSADSSAQGGERFAERIRTEIEALGIENKDSDAAEYLTISAGLVTRVPGEDDDINSFLREADRRLYRAKSAGRNRVVGD